MKYKTMKKDGWKVFCSAQGMDGLPDSINGLAMYMVI